MFQRILALLTCMLFSAPLRADDLKLQLLLEATHGSAETVQAILSEGAGANITDAKGTTPLMRAAGRGALPIVEVLLAHDAQVDAQDRDGYTALMRAAWRGYTNSV